MEMLQQVTWMTLFGVSLLFVGGFVLWVYGTEKPMMVERDEIPPPQYDLLRRFHDHVHWFLLYGAIVCFAGIGLLVTAIVMAI